MTAHLSRDQKIAQILRASAIVRLKLSSIPSLNEVGDMAVRAAEARVKSELQRELGGRFSFGSVGKYHLQMAGVGTTCADNGAALFRRWQIDASRKIQMMKAVAA